MKNKNNLILALVGVLIVMGAVLVFKQNKPNDNTDNGIILFYGIGCPHCAKVDEYVAANKISEKIKFERLEVFQNQRNAKVMAEKYTACGLNTAVGMGVPFLWDGANKKCYSGDVETINFFSQWAK